MASLSPRSPRPSSSSRPDGRPLVVGRSPLARKVLCFAGDMSGRRPSARRWRGGWPVACAGGSNRTLGIVARSEGPGGRGPVLAGVLRRSLAVAAQMVGGPVVVGRVDFSRWRVIIELLRFSSGRLSFSLFPASPTRRARLAASGSRSSPTRPNTRSSRSSCCARYGTTFPVGRCWCSGSSPGLSRLATA